MTVLAHARLNQIKRGLFQEKTHYNSLLAEGSELQDHWTIKVTHSRPLGSGKLLDANDVVRGEAYAVPRTIHSRICLGNNSSTKRDTDLVSCRVSARLSGLRVQITRRHREPRERPQSGFKRSVDARESALSCAGNVQYREQKSRRRGGHLSLQLIGDNHRRPVCVRAATITSIRACESPESRRSPPPTDTHNSRGVTGALQSS
ncbi:hypothetical protein EVAR_34030_1 [Eumeta japonica]|uniref:Uncharacterized protein n=1 Tax=Eumeta variegata TaxID=151549 RepID=A0A4C1VTE4_EUMVA|nr:hypothetical protein EVAR_34030_1 [Eumeta japonica]